MELLYQFVRQVIRHPPGFRRPVRGSVSAAQAEQESVARFDELRSAGYTLSQIAAQFVRCAARRSVSQGERATAAALSSPWRMVAALRAHAGTRRSV